MTPGLSEKLMGFRVSTFNCELIGEDVGQFGSVTVPTTDNFLLGVIIV